MTPRWQHTCAARPRGSSGPDPEHGPGLGWPGASVTGPAWFRVGVGEDSESTGPEEPEANNRRGFKVQRLRSWPGRSRTVTEGNARRDRR